MCQWGKELSSRDVGKQQQGFRLQKLRATKRLLSSIEADPNAVVYCAIENIEDVNHIVVEDEHTKNELEQDKEYDDSTKFYIFQRSS